MSFPTNFLWSVSTSAAQIEGAYDEDGKCLSIWDCIPKSKVKNNENCKVACDFYHRYKDDIKLMKELGIKTYRFSISFARIMPFYEKVNEKGLEFYSNLVDELLKNDITPIVTLYHWDLSYWLSEEGGFKSRKIVKYFEIYTKAVVEKLSDRVKYWITFNEPSCFLFNGYVQGVHAPFIKNPFLINRISKNYFYSNKAMVDIIRKYSKIEPKIGISYNCAPFLPKSDSLKDINEAKERTFNSNEGILTNSFLMDPVLLKKGRKVYGIFRISDKLASKIAVDIDFLAINNYSPAVNYLAKKEKAEFEKVNSLGWEVNGKGLYYMVKFAYERYHLPIFVSENGFCDNDKLINNEVHDEKRIEFLKEYLTYLEKAIDEGVPVFGYSYWTFTDNFEWAEGYEPRFGLVYVDFDNLNRIKKDSFNYYKKIIETNGKIIKEN